VSSTWQSPTESAPIEPFVPEPPHGEAVTGRPGSTAGGVYGTPQATRAINAQTPSGPRGIEGAPSSVLPNSGSTEEQATAASHFCR